MRYFFDIVDIFRKYENLIGKFGIFKTWRLFYKNFIINETI